MKSLRPSHIAKLFNYSTSDFWNLDKYGDHPPFSGYIRPESHYPGSISPKNNINRSKNSPQLFNRRILN